MDLPSFASFPSAAQRKGISSEEWQSCLESWVLLAQAQLLLSREAFNSKITKDPSIIEFLASYIDSYAQKSHLDNAQAESKLRKYTFYLNHRCLSELKKKPARLLEWKFLADLSIIYGKSPHIRTLLRDLWAREDLANRFQKHKISLIRYLEDDHAAKDGQIDQGINLARTVAFLKACPPYGQFLMLGSDFIDTLSMAYEKQDPSSRKKIVVIAYRCFLSLIDPLDPKFSMLLDHLYSLNSSRNDDSLLKAICSTTPFLRKLRERISGPDAVRGQKLVEELSLFEGTGTFPSRPKRPPRTKSNKGKGKEPDHEDGHGAFDHEIHVHRMSLISQIQDLFPDLGSGFVVKLLDEYGDDTEQVTAHLLDDSLPPHLKSSDRSEMLPEPNPESNDTKDLVPHLSPRTTPPLPPQRERRNIHDNDAFDRLAISPSQLHRGRRSSPFQTADTMLQDRISAPNRAAILSALAAFDSDDDERDDTYDVDDVGGTVDTAIPGNDDLDTSLNEEAVFRALKTSPELFERDAVTRRGQARTALKSETGMTDEAIEGWAVMLGRDPRRLRRLEERYQGFGGTGQMQQRELARTGYQGGSGTEESDRGEGGSSVRGARGGGFRGRGRGGGGGNVTGPAGEKATQVARQRKDAGKGSRANHNRRDQRARKMARGGFAG
ncbi:MAG: hypothetical protein Q9220_002027 [cf. Caloplaca sp. 1 TL-2023]